MEGIMDGVGRNALMTAAMFLSGAHDRVHGQDATAGRQTFAQCAACHALDATNGAGPSLKGVMGRKAGTVPGYRYSRAMRSANIVWDEDTMDAYIADPQKLIPGNLMPFSGLTNPKEREDLIAYLLSVK